jgi:polyisoprenoid-binding protein YceI
MRSASSASPITRQRSTGAIRLASVSTRDENRDAHLLSPDFFDADRHPEARFEATFVTPSKVVGNFTLRGVTKEIELRGAVAGPATDPWGGERIGLELTAVVDRNDFGIKWNAPLPGGGFLLPDDVRIAVDVSAVKGA